MRYLTLLLLFAFGLPDLASPSLLGTCVRAQKVLLFEKLTSSKSDRVYEGEDLRFRMKGDKFWQQGPIREIRPDIDALVINDRFIMLDEIDAVHRGRTFAGVAGYSLMTFGAGWAFFAVVGYNTDGDPTSQVGGRDIRISATALGAGYLLNKLFGKKIFKTGRYKRLRVIDTTF